MEAVDYSLSKNPAFSLRGSTKGFRHLVDKFFKERPKGKRLGTREVRYLFKVAYVYSFVSSKGIGYCGITKKRLHPFVAQFHHLDPKEKDHAMGNIGGRGLKSMEATNALKEKASAELAKCALLSADQHSYIHLGIPSPQEVDSLFSKSLFLSNLRYMEDLTMSLGLNRKGTNHHVRAKQPADRTAGTNAGVPG